jgi:hypothetical protein
MMPQDFDDECGMPHDCGWSTCGYIRPEPQEDDLGIGRDQPAWRRSLNQATVAATASVIGVGAIPS